MVLSKLPDGFLDAADTLIIKAQVQVIRCLISYWFIYLMSISDCAVGVSHISDHPF